MQVKTVIMWINNKIYQRHIRFMWLNIHRTQMYIFLNQRSQDDYMARTSGDSPQHAND